MGGKKKFNLIVVRSFVEGTRELNMNRIVWQFQHISRSPNYYTLNACSLRDLMRYVLWFGVGLLR